LKHTQEVILKNSIQCLDCMEILESKHRHDYVECGCPNMAMTDGGKDYLRRGAKDFSRVKDLSVVETRPVGCSSGICWRCENEAREKLNGATDI
jgi:hypothetical protein